MGKVNESFEIGETVILHTFDVQVPLPQIIKIIGKDHASYHLRAFVDYGNGDGTGPYKVRIKYEWIYKLSPVMAELCDI
jgi:hypothetical protein